jgi:hypothetical protein
LSSEALEAEALLSSEASESETVLSGNQQSILKRPLKLDGQG